MARAKKAAVAKDHPWLRYPLKPNDPVIVTINLMIERLQNNINLERRYLHRYLNDLLGDRPENQRDMKFEDMLSSEERTQKIEDEFDHYYINTTALDSLITSACEIKANELLRSQFMRVKLGLFGDPDYDGPGYARHLRKLMIEANQRITDKKAEHREYKRRQREFKRRRAARESASGAST